MPDDGRGALVFFGHVGHRKIDVLERRLRLCVTHHPLEDRQAHTGARHVGPEGVAKAVCVRVFESGGATAVSKEAAQPSSRDPLPPLPPLDSGGGVWV